MLDRPPETTPDKGAGEGEIDDQPDHTAYSDPVEQSHQNNHIPDIMLPRLFDKGQHGGHGQARVAQGIDQIHNAPEPFPFCLRFQSTTPLGCTSSLASLWQTRHTQAPFSLSHQQGGLRFAEPISSFYCISGTTCRTPTLIQEKHALLRRIQNISNRMDIYSSIITHLRRIVVYVGLFRYHCTRKVVLFAAISTVTPGHIYFC